VDGTWNVPTTLGGQHMECAYYFLDGTWNELTTLTFVGCVVQTHGCKRNLVNSGFLLYGLFITCITCDNSFEV